MRFTSAVSDVKHFPCGFGSAQPLPVVSAHVSAAVVNGVKGRVASLHAALLSPGSVVMPICGLFTSSSLNCNSPQERGETKV